MKGKAWAPGHITGFFEIQLNDSYKKAGSRGAGINLNRGVTAEAEVNENKETEINCSGILNYALKSLINELDKNYFTKISFKKKIPIGVGFGASGAECLSGLLAFNEAIGNRFTKNKLVNLAHKIEIKKRTGLGDVVPQSLGGLVIRKRGGDSFNSITDKIPVREKKLYFYLFEPINTSEILNSKQKRKEINKISKKRTEQLIKEPSLNNFFRLSREFTLKTELGNKKIIKEIQKSKKETTMTMLGNGIFSTSKLDEINPQNYFSANISLKGASLV